MSDQASLFAFERGGWYVPVPVPEPPTGPAAIVPTKGEGTPAAYGAWRESEDGRDAWRWILAQAREALKRGERRVSPRTLVAQCRDVLKVQINDHFSPWVADDLIRAEPALLDVIERRRRRVLA